MGVPTNCLISAILRKTGDSNETALTTTESIEEICGCLIRASPAGRTSFATVSLSHYTVCEFLYSDRIPTSPVSYFALSDQTDPRNVLTEITTLAHPDKDAMVSSTFYHSLDSYCSTVVKLAPFVWETIIIDNEELFSSTSLFYYCTTGIAS